MSDYVSQEPRMDLRRAAPQLFEAQAALHDKAVGFLDPLLAELVMLRAAQVNGSVAGVDTHAARAEERGENGRRLHSLGLWRESGLFTAKEQAALALTESMALVGEAPVEDEVWEEATARFSEGELVHLLFTIATTNAVNQLDVTVRRRPE